MLKFRFDFVFIFLSICNSGVVAQTTPELVLPSELHGVIKLNISTIQKENNEIIDFDFLTVFVKNERGEYNSNPIQGQYTKEGDYLVFKPFFLFESGMNYVVETKNTNSDSTDFYQSFRIGNKKKIEEAKVVGIYPSANQLPENLLRFYIYFNTPMKKGQALKYIQLTDAEGNIDNYVFMEFKQELWSADGKRLTILFDPGRIKRGVSTNIQRGPALLEGKGYNLNISDDWQDVYGQQLSIRTSKKFEVIKAYRHHITVNDWDINQPQENSYDALTIHFDRIIDHALIQSMIKLIDADENHVTGYWEILEKEQLIQFIPNKKWKKGNYRIKINSRFEDVVGNNLQNLLDHNENEDNDSRLYHFIEFKI